MPHPGSSGVIKESGEFDWRAELLNRNLASPNKAVQLVLCPVDAKRAQLIAVLGALSVLCAAPARAQAHPRPASQTGQVRVCAGGDVTLGTNLDTTWTSTALSRYGVHFAAFPNPDSLLAPILAYASDADILLLNIEGAIGDNTSAGPTKCSTDSRHCFAFRQPVQAAEALGRMSQTLVVVGNVANNHSRDAGELGFRSTVRSLRGAGVQVTGADTLPTIVVTRAGDTVAFLGFHTSQETPDARDLAAVRRHVSRAAARWPRLVVTAHIGGEGVGAQHTRDAVEMFFGTNRGNPMAFGRTAIDAGADWVVAHGPHVVRAGEWRRDGLILYSLGNLLTYGPFLLTEPMNRGAMACASLGEAGRPEDVRIIPTYQVYPGRLMRDSTARAIALINSLSALDFPRTGIAVDSAGYLKRFD